jgi:hypothetical protein
MKATFVITHGNSSRATRSLNEASQLLEGIYGKDVYLTIGVHDDSLEEAIQRIHAHCEIISTEEKTIEIGPYLVKYKLIQTR